MRNYNDPYWKIIVTEDEGLRAVCLQDFDEHDYDQTKFLSQYHFESEDQANEMIRGIYSFIGKYVIKKIIQCS